MPLTATQRQFILNKLGVRPRGGKKAHAMRSGEFLDRDLQAALDAYLLVEAKVLESVAALQAIPGTDAVTADFNRDVATTQRVVAQSKRDGGKAKLEQATTTLTEVQEKARVALQLVKANAQFYKELDAASKALVELKAHAQHAHVDGEISTAGDELVKARDQAKAGDFTQARTALTTATKALSEGKGCANAFAAYVPVRASAGRIVTAVKTWWDRSAELGTADAAVTPPARKYTKASTDLKALIKDVKAWIESEFVARNETRIATLEGHATTMRDNMKYKPATLSKALVDEKGPTAADADVTAIKALIAEVKAHIAAERWGQAVMTARTNILNSFAIAERTAQRRLKYDTQRRTTLDKIASLASGTDQIKGKKGADPLIGFMFSLQALVKRADGLASRESMRMEDGITELLSIEATCADLVSVAVASSGYLSERVVADQRFKALKALPAAPHIADAIAAIDKLLAAAVKATGIVNAEVAISAAGKEDHKAEAQDWTAARKMVEQATTQMAAAEALAATLAGAAALVDQAGAADDAPKINAAVLALRTQATTAKTTPNADAATQEYKDLFDMLDAASAQAKAGQIKTAGEMLKGAAELLVTAQTMQSERARYLAAHAPIDQRAKVLAVVTLPPAAQIKGKTDAVVALLEKADAFNTARDWANAQATLTQAAAGATEAELIRDLRKAYNKRAKELEQLRLVLTDPLKKEVADVMAKALASANEFDLDYANRFLDNAEARIDGATVAKFASNPSNPKFIEAVERMLLAKGGQELLARATDNPTQLRNKDKITGQDGKEIAYGKQLLSGPELLDQIVKGLPDNVAPKVIQALCKKRFGIDLYVSALYDEGSKVKEEVRANPGDENYNEPAGFKNFTQRTKSARKMYEMLALVPEQAKDNPSMKRVERRDALKKNNDGSASGDVSSGGFYQSKDESDQGLVVMSGRPDGSSMQKFGAAQVGYVDGGGTTPQLPDKIEPGYEPANTDEVDYFDFATVHEVGHAVDDRMAFMASRGSRPEYGGWISYGGNLDPIVKAVAKHCGYNSTPEQEQYIADLMTGNKPPAPIAPPREAVAWEAARKKVDAWYAIVTNEKLWWNQAQCVAVTIEGVIYQEAYKGTWVSYLASGRSKALTGYQFRAPGEWFAELYAGYHCGKLKKGHPARQWLSSLSL